MDSLKNMNNALAFIEKNLTNDIDIHEAAKRAFCSEYHFTRMFSFLAGVTLSEYIRRRRLTLAAFELNDSQNRVIDVAMKYGYNSPDSFTRAFHTLHGITPSEARNDGKTLKAYSRMTFQLSIRGGSEMNYRIEEKEPFKVVGVKKRVPVQFEGVSKDIEKLAESITDEQYEKMYSYDNMEPHQVVNASYNFDEGRSEEKGFVDHMIGIPTTKEVPFDEFEVLEIPSHTWAIFSPKGAFPQVMQDTWAKIFAEWLPSSDYELVEAPEISFVEDVSYPDQVYSEIWIAVKKEINYRGRA